MVRIFDQTEIGASWLCDNTDFMELPLEDSELFLASLILNLRSAKLAAHTKEVIVPERPENGNVKVKKDKKGKETKTSEEKETSVVDMEKECSGEFSIAKDSKCQNGECTGKKKKECVKTIETKVEKKAEEAKEEKGPRKLDKFGFDVNSNTGKMNAMLILGEFSKKEIVEKLGCAEGSLNVHFANLRKKGFKLKENKDGKWKLTKTKIK